MKESIRILIVLINRQRPDQMKVNTIIKIKKNMGLKDQVKLIVRN